jgi:hypothetical protein
MMGCLYEIFPSKTQPITFKRPLQESVSDFQVGEST